MRVINNKALKALYNIPQEYSTEKMYKELEAFTLDETILIERCKYMYKIQHGKLKYNAKIKYNSDIHNYATRNKAQIHITNVNTSTGKKTTENICAKVYNGIPKNIKEKKSTKEFINELKKHIKNSQCK